MCITAFDILAMLGKWCMRSSTYREKKGNYYSTELKFIENACLNVDNLFVAGKLKRVE